MKAMKAKSGLTQTAIYSWHGNTVDADSELDVPGDADEDVHKDGGHYSRTPRTPTWS
jgi:hypothetical protein